MNTVIHLKSTDGLKLSGQSWMPDAMPKALVCLIHGLGEHCGRYQHVAKAFNSNGIALTALDLRGHGKSDGKRGHTPNYDLLLEDISKLLNYTKSIAPETPLFLYGHSLGGNLVIQYALKKHPDIVGIIASAPLLRLAFQPPAWQENLLKTLQRMNVSAGMPNGLNTKNLSRDPDVVRNYNHDPLTHNRITPALAIGMVEAGEWNLKHAHELTLPMLLFHGTDDRITSPEASVEFARSAGKNCAFKSLNGLYHEPHNEPEKEQLLNSIIQWILGRI